MATSCVKDVVLDAKEEPQVVVECILTDEPVQTLHLVYTKGASRSEAPELPEAEAVLTDLTEGREAGRFKRTPDGSWTLAYTALAEHRYRLDVSVPGHGPIWAEQTMPEAPGIVVGWHRWDPEPDRNDNTVGYSFRLLSARNPIWFYGVNYPTLESPGEKTEFLCTNSLAVDPFNETEGWRFIEESSGNYLWGDKKSSGFRTTQYPVLQEAPLHKRYLRFPAMEDAPDTTFFVSGSFQGYISNTRDFLHAKMRPAELRYFSASEDYDRFLKDSYHLLDLKLSKDLADIFVRDNVHSNVHGAIGLFGAKMERLLEWEGKNTWQASGYFLLASFVADHYEYSLEEQERGLGRNFPKQILTTRPFELLHYEYWHLAGEEYVPVWAPPRTDETTVHDRYSLTVIEDQAQLEAEGIRDCGAIDFTKKKVLVLAVGVYNTVPILVSYGGRGSTGAWRDEWQEGHYAPIFMYTSIVSGVSIPIFTPFRIAIAVDKEDPIVSDINFWDDFGVLVSMNDDRARELSDSLAWTLP